MTLSVSAAKGSQKSFGINEVLPVETVQNNDAATDGIMTKVYHGVSITAGDGANIIGRIQSWQPDSHTRDGVHLYELSNVAFGRPVDFIPGKATGFTISVTRAEVWGAEMEKAFAVNDEDWGILDDLCDQFRPFKIKEFWIRATPEEAYKEYHVYEYRGCWFTNKNMEAITSDGDGITKISATLAYVSRKLIVS